MAKATTNRAALQHHFDVSPKCRRCGSVTSFDVSATHPLRATLEHLYKANDPRREEMRTLPVVARTTLFCYRCNNADGVRHGAILALLRTLAQREAKDLGTLISGELHFGGYIDSESVAKVKAMLESRFVSKEYLSRIKELVNETDRVEQEMVRITKLLNAHRKWLHALPGVLYISVGLRAPARICLCVGGSLAPNVKQSIRDKIGDDADFEEIADGTGPAKGRVVGNGTLGD